MKTFLLAAGMILIARAAAPQTSVPAVSLPRADAHVVAGWQNLHKPQPQLSYNDWLNAILYGGAGAGWYWTDHLKTQIDIGAGTRGHQYRTDQFVIDGMPAYVSSRVAIREMNVSVSQQYQFFHNQWFHPHVGAGVEAVRETSTEEYQPVVIFDNATRSTRVVSAAHTTGPEHRVFARAFGEGGFKAYMTPRAFFIGDMRVMFRSGIDEVLFRAGFGFDF